jgi:phosphoribosyl 1,2-cyclic phosphodiesterase
MPKNLEPPSGQMLKEGKGRTSTQKSSDRANSTRLKIWGVRGSIPVPGPSTVRYGGNTTCLEVRAEGEIIVLDAGSGARLLGIELEREFGSKPISLTLLSTHAHWDHVQGLPFFLPAYKEKNEIRLWGYKGVGGDFSAILSRQMATPFFPVRMRDLPSKLLIDELSEMEFKVGPIRVRSRFVNHPGNCVGYRLFTRAGSISFVPDHEPYEFHKLHATAIARATPEQARKFAVIERRKLVEFLRESDLLMLDAQYTDEEYPQHAGWGHGSLTTSVDLAVDAKVRKLLLFHHDPGHDDEMIDQMVEQARQMAVRRGSNMEIEAAREGAEFVLDAR